MASLKVEVGLRKLLTWQSLRFLLIALDVDPAQKDVQKLRHLIMTEHLDAAATLHLHFGFD